ncbi:MAG: helix-turn-helix domain-containing protein [Methanomicrobiales archaeon]|nr:helix-turn-helix domain-containing protein [Methanomicrobiales archaeon]
MAPEYCSTKEAAWRLGVSVERIRYLVRAGVLRGGRPGGSGYYRVLIRSVDEYQRRRRSD